MKLKDLTKWAGIFILGVALIIVYKTFDNLGGIMAGIGRFFGIIGPAFAGAAVAYILYPAVLRVERLFGKAKVEFIAKRSRVFGVLSVYIAAIAVIALLLGFAIKPLVESVIDLVNNLETIIAGINTTGLIELNYDQIMNAISLEQLITYVSLGDLTARVNSIGAGLFKSLFALVISVYILIDRESLKSFFDRIGNLCFKEHTYSSIKQYLKKFNGFVYKYLFCVLIDAGIVGAASLVLLLAMRVRYAPILALIMALFNVIPYFGSIISSVTAIVVTAFTANSAAKVVGVAVALLILQQIDGNYIQPRLAGHQLKVRPFWVIIGVLVGGGLFGVLGIMLAAPVIAFLKTVTNDLFGYLEAKKKLD